MNTRKTSIFKNYIYNLAYQILIIILPIITVPYISGVLGSEGLGIYAFTFAISQYALLVGSPGISLYGNRAIAVIRHNKKELNETFWNIVYLNVFTAFTAFLLFIIFIFISHLKYKNILLIQSIAILALIFDISWFFMGMEDFKKTVSRNFCVKILGLIFVFIFIKNRSDTWLYALIINLSVLLGNLSFWLYLPKYNLKILKPNLFNIKKIVLSSFLLFLPQISVRIFESIDKIMLGIYSCTSEIGNFDVAQKIALILMTIPGSIYVVLLPRLSNLGENNPAENKRYFNTAISYVLAISLPLFFGLFAATDTLVPWLLGTSFEKVKILLKILSFLLLFLPVGLIFTSQLIALKKDKAYNFSLVTGTIFNIVLNLCLIPYLKSVGAAIVYVATFITIDTVMILLLRKYFDVKPITRETIKYIIGSILVYFAVTLIGYELGTKIITTIIQTFTAIILYITILNILKAEILTSNIQKIKNQLKKLIFTSNGIDKNPMEKKENESF